MYTARLLLFLIDLVFGIIQAILMLRIILELFAANSSTPFVAWTYDISNTLLYPFHNIFPSPVLRGGFLLDISAVVAVLAYALLAYFVTELIRFVNYQSTRYYNK
jgi:uncharacterized protein YggT (Ycf19 family)